MNTQKIIFLTLSLAVLSGCFANNNAQLNATEQLNRVEEKINALVSYTNKTHDIITDIDLRLDTLEQDAKKRGVPTRVKGKDITVAKVEFMQHQPQVPTPPTTQNTTHTTQVQDQSQHLLPLQNMSAPSQTMPANNRRLGNSHVMAKGLTINTGNNVPPNTLQFPAHAELGAPIPVTPAAIAIHAIQAQANSLLQQNIIPTTSYHPPTTIGSITGQNLTQQTNTRPQTSPVLQQKPTPVKAKKPYVPAQAKITKRNLIPKDYNSAMNLYKTRKYEQAEQAFNAFLQANPSGVLAPNALYWKGETFYARGNYPQAIFAFKEVQTRYPKHAKAPDALLKTAMSYDKLGDVANADLHYLVLREDFPASSAAKRTPR